MSLLVTRRAILIIIKSSKIQTFVEENKESTYLGISKINKTREYTTVLSTHKYVSKFGRKMRNTKSHCRTKLLGRYVCRRRIINYLCIIKETHVGAWLYIV